MNAARHKTIVDGLSSTAKKVYDLIPIESSISRNEVCFELKKAGVSLTSSAVDRCLGSLIDAKLVTQPKPGSYSRVFKGETMHPKQKAAPSKQLASDMEMLMQRSSERTLNALQANVVEQEPVIEEAPVTATKENNLKTQTDEDLTSAIMGIGIRLADTIGVLQQLSSEFSDLAIEVDRRMQENSEARNKLQQLTGLLRSIAN